MAWTLRFSYSRFSYLRRKWRLCVGIAIVDIFMHVSRSLCTHVYGRACLCMQDTTVSQSLHWTRSTAKFGADPLSNFECPHCQVVVTTRTREVVAWSSFLCLIIGCIFCGVLALLLLCILNYYDVQHYCPACGESVGAYIRCLQ